jgi:hypothetical protein
MRSTKGYQAWNDTRGGVFTLPVAEILDLYEIALK